MTVIDVKLHLTHSDILQNLKEYKEYYEIIKVLLLQFYIKTEIQLYSDPDIYKYINTKD